MNVDALGRPLHQRRHLNQVEVVTAVTLFQEGHSVRSIARRLQTSHSVISRLLNRHREFGFITRRPYPARERVTNPREDRNLVRLATQNRARTARNIADLHFDASERRISTQTVRNRLHEAHLRSRVRAVRPQLTRAHRRARLTFSRNHINWDMDQWGHVLFSDESRFRLSHNDARVRAWRRRGERYLDSTVTETVHFGGGSLMVWGGITLTGRTGLHICRDGVVNAHRYLEDIVEPYIVPFAAEEGPQFILQHDNARPHTARIVTQYLEENNIEVLEWPANSPDLNPIEHLWDVLQRRIRDRPAPENLEQLGEMLQEEWNNIPREVIRNLVESMPRRCEEVRLARGGHTHY